MNLHIVPEKKAQVPAFNRGEGGECWKRIRKDDTFLDDYDDYDDQDDYNGYSDFDAL